MGLEESHLCIKPEVEAKKWFIKNPVLEDILSKCTIKYQLTTVRNTFSDSGKKIEFSVYKKKDDTPALSFTGTMELMHGNCGACVWYGQRNTHSEQNMLLAEFIAKNIASYAGLGVIFASGHKADLNHLKKSDDKWVLRGHPSSRGGYPMVNGFLNIPREKMAKTSGYNHEY